MVSEMNIVARCGINQHKQWTLSNFSDAAKLDFFTHHVSSIASFLNEYFSLQSVFYAKLKIMCVVVHKFKCVGQMYKDI